MASIRKTLKPSERRSKVEAKRGEKSSAHKVKGAYIQASSRTPLTGQQRAEAFEAWALSHESGGRLLTDEDISRESIYEE